MSNSRPRARRRANDLLSEFPFADDVDDALHRSIAPLDVQRSPSRSCGLAERVRNAPRFHDSDRDRERFRHTVGKLLC